MRKNKKYGHKKVTDHFDSEIGWNTTDCRWVNGVELILKGDTLNGALLF
jgi:hypothetical protein